MGRTLHRRVPRTSLATLCLAVAAHAVTGCGGDGAEEGPRATGSGVHVDSGVILTPAEEIVPGDTALGDTARGDTIVRDTGARRDTTAIATTTPATPRTAPPDRAAAPAGRAPRGDLLLATRERARGGRRAR